MPPSLSLLSPRSSMIGAYFVGRTELLSWLNALCATELTRVEQASSGAVACQVLDALFPATMPMNRVDWAASQPHECVGNYKLLQQILAVLNIDKQVPVDRLIRGKYQDNLEFLQWLKALYDRHGPPSQPYDARARRAKGKGGAQYNVASCAHTPGKQRARAATADSSLHRRSRRRLCSAGDTEEAEVATVLEKMEDMKIKSEGLTEEKEALVRHIHELQENVQRIKQERDFYFNKLEAIAELVHDAELSKTTTAQTNLLGLSVLDVLFATEEDDDEETVLPF